MARQAANAETRPDPDALLALTSRTRGRLKVFLGAAPGVGKTFAMLQNARRVRDEGNDVVIGLVETHGRRETAALVDGLEILPRREIVYRGRGLSEFDLDAALVRRPALIVVDELAHTNAPEQRHPKRWQDVDELLDAGIDVWTALNIQHLESLADVVSRITGVTVRETVPDTVLRDADDVVLVDITPDELIGRLKEGKVYVPETARRATESFFTPGNLTALREMALRRTADRVDDQMVDWLRQKAIEGPWATSERLLACIAADDVSEAVVRATARLATGLNAPWIVVHAERPGEQSDAASGQRIDDLFRLAERLGGETRRVSGSDLVGQILRLARSENATQIVIGRSRGGWWKRFVGRSLVDALLQKSSDVGVHVMTSASPAAVRRPWFVMPPVTRLTAELACAVAAVAVAVGTGMLLSRWLLLPNLSMIFLAAVLFCAVTYGVRSAVAASVLSFFAYNFFFIAPVYTFTVAEPHELLALLVFLAVAVLTGSLAGRLRDQSQATQRRARSTQALFDFVRKLSAASALDEVLWVSAGHLNQTLASRVAFLVPEGGLLNLRLVWPPEDELDAGATSAATWAFEKSEPAGWRTGTLPTIAFQFRPLVTPRGVVGVCGIEPRRRDEPLDAEDERTLTAILDQTAIAADRSLLVGEAVKAAALEENDNVRSALLASLSHDLRTPLASITGAVTGLRQMGDAIAPADRADLLQSIDEEATRLGGFVANLLDMSRLEAGAIRMRKDWVDVADAIRAAVERIRKVHPGQRMQVSIEQGLPFLRGDATLLEQVIYNVLDNAHKYGGEAGAVVHGRRDGADVLVSVTDEGPGVKPADLERIFEKFYRGGRADGRSAGTGLGLSISKGLVEAMGGTILAQSPAARRRGTRIILRFPAAVAPVEPGAPEPVAP